MVLFFFFKQKTAYEMRISDWSSDVCSSDLVPAPRHSGGRGRGDLQQVHLPLPPLELFARRAPPWCASDGASRGLRQVPERPALAEIGRASWRERGGQYV